MNKEIYWSSTTDVSLLHDALIVIFFNGLVFNIGKADEYQVLAVSGGAL